jgi:hypothetical protein
MDCWTLVGHAVALRVKGVTLVSPGVAVRLEGDEHVAAVYGGHREAVDEASVLAAARVALEDWPVDISRVEIIVTEPERMTRGDAVAIARAHAKRQRRAARVQGRA